MLQNYFFLNRFILDLTPLLVNSKIEEIYSQEKSKLVIVTSKNTDFYFLEISVIPGNSYMNVRNNYSRAKKNTLNFFNGAEGQTINSIQIAEDDRIIKISCSDSTFYFAIRGKYTNVFVIDNFQNIESFKSIDTQGRTNLWVLTWNNSFDTPFFGNGTGSAGKLINSRYPPLEHPHNDYLFVYFVKFQKR